MASRDPHAGTLPDLRARVAQVIGQRGLLRLPEPVQLASGAMSRDFVDGKKALSDGRDLELACAAVLGVAGELGIEFDAVGGMTLGADQFAHVIAVMAGRRWFVVRKAAKGRGTNRRIEGAELGPGVRVLLLDDVITLGGSIREAYQVVRGTGATVTGVVCLVDRSDVAAPFFTAEGVPYQPVITYRDLGIEPVQEPLSSSAVP